ncbi:unnamed protein product, partial [Brachionus calyciflorus]
MKKENPNLANIPFGGKKFLIGGDFRQTLPVVLRGHRADIINATIKSSYLWNHVRKFKLINNMRLINDTNSNYRQFLLNLGDGVLPTSTINEIPDFITLPDNIQIPLDKVDLLRRIYNDFSNQFNSSEYIDQRSILCPSNKDTDEINEFASNEL